METLESDPSTQLQPESEFKGASSNEFRNARTSYLWILLVCLLIGYFCCHLNQLLYRHHQPFFDSLSYNDKLYKVMKQSAEEGLGVALKTACFTNSTNCFPFIVGALIGPFVEPSRMVGVWIQTGLLFFFLSSVFYYLHQIKSVDHRLALAGTFAFLTAKCLYIANGGLSDFRMDLSLYLAYGATATWLLAALDRPHRWHFFALGAAAALACLFRATAPVYLLLGCGPVFLWEIIFGNSRVEKIFGTGLAFGVVAIFAGWFYFLNFDYLRYYYVEWNTDANAKIPISDALKHFELAQRSAGSAVMLLVICWGVGTMLRTGRVESVTQWVGRAVKDREFDWRIIWIGAAPVLMLVARQAGLNGLVSMPAVYGMILFFVLPVVCQANHLKDAWLNQFLIIILSLCVVVALARGFQRHVRCKFDTMAMNHALIDLMIADAKTNQATDANFGVLHLSDLSSDALFSTLVFDREADDKELYAVTVEGIRLSPIPTFMIPAKADWNNVDGEDDQEKIEKLLADANRLMHYVVLPDLETATLLAETKPFNYINRFIVPIRKRIIEDPNWKLVKGSIAANDRETVEVWRRSR